MKLVNHLIASCVLVSASLPAFAQDDTSMGARYAAQAEREKLVEEGLAGNSEALFKAALLYKTADLSRHKELLKAAAEAGHPRAQALYGDLFHYEQYGTRQDYKTARKWYEKAAAQNDSEGLKELGKLYNKGNGVRQNLETAAGYWKRSSDLGDGFASLLYGYHYLELRGHKAEAADYYQLAYARGVELGLEYLADLGDEYGAMAAAIITSTPCEKSSDGFDALRSNPQSKLDIVRPEKISQTSHDFWWGELYDRCFHTDWREPQTQTGGFRLTAKLDEQTTAAFAAYSQEATRQGKLADDGWQDSWLRKSPIDPGRDHFRGPGADQFDALAKVWLVQDEARTIKNFYGVRIEVPNSGIGSDGLSSYDTEDEMGLGFFRVNSAAKGSGAGYAGGWGKNFVDEIREQSKAQGGLLGYLGPIPVTNSVSDIPAIHNGPFIKTKLGQDYYFGQMKDGYPHGIGYLIMPALDEIYIGSFVDGYAHGFGGFVQKQDGRVRQLKVGQYVASRGPVLGLIRTDMGTAAEIQRVGAFADGNLSGFGQRQIMSKLSPNFGLVEQGLFKNDTFLAGVRGSGSQLFQFPDALASAEGEWVHLSNLKTNDVILKRARPYVIGSNAQGAGLIQSGGERQDDVSLRVGVDGDLSDHPSQPFRNFAFVYYPHTDTAQINLKHYLDDQQKERERRLAAKRYQDWAIKTRERWAEEEKAKCLADPKCDYGAAPEVWGNTKYEPSTSSFTSYSSSSSSSTYNDPFGGLNPWSTQYQTQQWMSDPGRYNRPF
ncbi:hypothetical protein [Parvularcula marina]|uniref:hypothetical protein n=1 Tax=Parvularcula marina TaxID=2292771 RepID=UPI0035135E72